MKWIAGHYEWVFPRPVMIMGIVNVTPDSFSDGGRYLSTEAAVAHALTLAAEGADLLDIGGESTRPGAAPVSEAEELARVLPVFSRLAGRVSVPLSIDTQKPAVAREAIAVGASVVNDTAAHRAPPEMWELMATTGAGYVCMHSQGTPQTMPAAPEYDDVVGELRAFFGERLRSLAQAGVRAEQIVLDVGIGFGKTWEHNLQLLAALDSFRSLDRPLLLGVSRKSFIGKLLGVEVAERLPASLACAVWATQLGVEIIRTHDVAATRQAVRMTEALLARA